MAAGKEKLADDEDQLGARTAKYKDSGGWSVQTTSIEGRMSDERGPMGERQAKTVKEGGGRGRGGETKRAGKKGNKGSATKGRKPAGQERRRPQRDGDSLSPPDGRRCLTGPETAASRCQSLPPTDCEKEADSLARSPRRVEVRQPAVAVAAWRRRTARQLICQVQCSVARGGCRT